MATTWTAVVNTLRVCLKDCLKHQSTFIKLQTFSTSMENKFTERYLQCVGSKRSFSFTVLRWTASESSFNVDNNKRSKRSRTPWLETGKELLIWEGYKRNHKGAIPPVKTRIRCKRGEGRICGNPCPVCRSQVNVHFRNTKLLEQFICPHTGQILEASKTGLCRQQQKRIVAAIEKAWDYGLMTFTIPRQLPERRIGIPPWNKLDVKY